jgi:hypothetical protein
VRSPFLARALRGVLVRTTLMGLPPAWHSSALPF